jgi:hypothetical protein
VLSAAGSFFAVGGEELKSFPRMPETYDGFAARVWGGTPWISNRCLPFSRRERRASGMPSGR